MESAFDVNGGLLVLSPENVEFQTAFPEGVEFQAEFTLENKSRLDLIVKKVLSSCGCTAVFMKDGQPFKIPFILSPSKPLPIQVNIGTKGSEGKMSVSIIFQYEYGGKSFISVGQILFEVLGQDGASDTETDEIQSNELR